MFLQQHHRIIVKLLIFFIETFSLLTSPDRPVVTLPLSDSGINCLELIFCGSYNFFDGRFFYPLSGLYFIMEQQIDPQQILSSRQPFIFVGKLPNGK